jgi:hypothetical protein
MANLHPNVESVARAVSALGSAIRGDWGSIDGRTIRDSMDGLAACLLSPMPMSYETLCAMVMVCPQQQSWPEYCDDKGEWTCIHIEAALEAAKNGSHE